MPLSPSLRLDWLAALAWQPGRPGCWPDACSPESEGAPPESYQGTSIVRPGPSRESTGVERSVQCVQAHLGHPHLGLHFVFLTHQDLDSVMEDESGSVSL